MNSALYLPLLSQGQCVGLLALAGKVPNAFGTAEIAQAEAFRDQALIAIENVRLFEAEQQCTQELTEALEQQTATSEVLSVISSSTGDLQPVFQAMLANTVRICDANFGNIYRWDGEVLRLVAGHNTPPALLEARKHSPLRPAVNDPISRMITSKTVIHVRDAREEQAYIEREPSITVGVELGGVRTFGLSPC